MQRLLKAANLSTFLSTVKSKAFQGMSPLFHNYFVYYYCY